MPFDYKKKNVRGDILKVILLGYVLAEQMFLMWKKW